MTDANEWHEIKSGTRIENVSDYVFDNGETITYICPYVKDLDGNKIYGSIRTVIYNVRIRGSMNTTYWETSTSVNQPTLTINWGV